MRRVKNLQFICAILFSFCFCFGQDSAPPNSPALVSLENNDITLKYEGKVLFRGSIQTKAEQYTWHSVVDDRHGVVNQVVVFTSKDWNVPFAMNGEIVGSGESFPCEADRRPRGIDIVRHSYGMSHSLLNRAVYDRNRDWVVSFDYYANVTIVPDPEEGGRFQFTAKGNEVILRFRPHYFQKHRGLEYFQPWTYAVWQKPVVGWCSWFAYHQDITEENIKHTADVLSATLKPYGYEYLQIDDGYQRGQGLPELWLQPNEKFPGGLKNLAGYIQSKGLSPGIWTNVAFDQRDFAEQHKDWFVLDDRDSLGIGNWIDISIDGSNEKALDAIIRPVYSGLRHMGWSYFKVDALRHLRYEGYNADMEYFQKKNLDRVETYRTVVKTIRNEISRDTYMLGCWGIRPELVGIIDGCRIGGDGFSYAGLAQYNSFNNIVWRNDPDHVELTDKDAYRSTMVTSLTGSVLMLTDKPDKYTTSLVEPAKRAAPVLFTVPGQIFDVDPSRSQTLDRVNSEVSGSGPRPFDAGDTPRCELYLLEVNKPYESWVVLGRTGGAFERIAFADLGLSKDREYVVFEFWSKRELGNFVKEFNPGPINPQFNCQLFCIREKQSHPQLVATNRHISCGGLEVDDIRWKDDVLSGESRLVADDPYDLYISEPAGYDFEKVSCEGADVVSSEKTGSLLVCHMRSAKGGRVSWQIVFEHKEK
ncbi:MAG: glycoside hydrolase family 36 protein [Bacteroidota bacterium]|jgi:hypothetical protein